MKTIKLSKDTHHSSAMRYVVDIDGYPLYFDQPVDWGGEASAPVPHDYFDASIVACKAMVIRIVAKRRGYALDEVNITLNVDDSNERNGRYIMNFDIELIGDLDDKARKMLLNAAEQCPVGKLATDAVTVEFNSRLI